MEVVHKVQPLLPVFFSPALALLESTPEFRNQRSNSGFKDLWILRKFLTGVYALLESADPSTGKLMGPELYEKLFGNYGQ